jgi:hypothetical protein
MSERPSFRQMILLIASGAALALFGCLGAIMAGENGALVLVGGTGFIAGLILLMLNLWRLFRDVPVGKWPRASTWNPPAHDGSTNADGGEPPQSPQK